MELFFIFCAVLVIYSGYVTFCDLLKTEEKNIAYAKTELRVLENAGRMVLLLARQRLAVARDYAKVRDVPHWRPVSRATT